MQREMPFVSTLKPPVMAPDDLITRQGTLLDAVRLCVQMSNLSNWALCEALGIDRGHFTRMMQGKASLPLSKLPDLMRVAGNYAPLQWLAGEMGFQLVEKAKDERIRELETLLTKLKAAA